MNLDKLTRRSLMGLGAGAGLAMAAPPIAARALSRDWQRPGDPTEPDIVIGAPADPSSRYRFPSAVKLADGRIAVVARDAASHFHGPSRTIMYTSADDGTTWTGPRVVQDSHGDDRDPMIAQTASGRILVSYFVSDNLRLGDVVNGVFVTYSDDGGETWSTPYRVESAMDAPGWSAEHGQITQVADGSLLIPLYGVLPGDPHWRQSVVRSLDDGTTWKGETEVFLPDTYTPGKPMPSELTLTQLDSGTLTGLIRRDYQPSALCRSADAGRTWSAAEELPVITSSADTMVLTNGDVFLAYGDESHRFGLRRLTSATVIRHPDGPWTVRATSPVWDAFVDDQANPSIVEIRPGLVMVFGFDYTHRSLVATYVRVSAVDKVTDAEQLRGRVDLAGMVAAHTASINTDMTLTGPNPPHTGPLGAVDGVLGLDSGAQGASTGSASYTVDFTAPQGIREFGMALRPGESQSAVAQVQHNGSWIDVGRLDERVRYGDMHWFAVPGADHQVTAVRVTTTQQKGPRRPNSGAMKPLVITEVAVRGH